MARFLAFAIATGAMLVAPLGCESGDPIGNSGSSRIAPTVSGADTTRVVYIGKLVDTDAVIAISASGNDVVAYICGGATTFATTTRWFPHTEWASDQPTLRMSSDGWTLDLVRDAQGISGSASDGTGKRYAITAHPTRPETMAGLYAVVDEGCRTGVVVMQDRAEDAPTFQGTWCNNKGAFEQVTPVRPYDRWAGRVAVTVHVGGENRMLYAANFSPFVQSR
jgi:hypothetical protein